jgi:type IX secretion system PorP/SprF family membrane protein
MIKKILLFIAFLPIVSFGQQSSLMSHFYENPTLFNPSLVGLSTNTTIKVNARQQWYKFTDANIGRSSIIINKALKDDNGFGFNIYSDNSGNIINSGIKINYAKRVLISKESYVLFGLSGGYQNNQISNVSASDFLFLDNQFNWSPNASFGMSYSKKSLVIGMSIDGLLESDLGFTKNENIYEKNLYSFISYGVSLNDAIYFSPAMLYKHSESGTTQFDFNFNFSYQDVLSLGFGYKGNFIENSDFGPLVTLGLNFSNIKSLVSQEFTMSELSSYSVGTTELTFSYEVPNTQEKKKESIVEVIAEIKKPKDSDNDGVIDDEDECPNLYGSVAAKGCPDVDNDGVRDSDDLCPNTIGDMLNGGCPVLSEKDSLILSRAMTNLEFDKNSAELKSNSFKYLSNIGKLLLGNKNMLLIIDGHTDSDANDDYNFSLSARRAQAVRDYLMKMGIPKSRLIIDFHGESIPIAPNDNDSNKQKNRRVEFAVTFI